jgi:hypothetical protein
MGRFSWSSVDWNKPVVCVMLSQPETQPMWDSIVKPSNFIPFQNGVMELKKLMPYPKKVNAAHVVNVYGTGMTPTAMTAMILEINKESNAAVAWGRNQVQRKMMTAMSTVGLKVGVTHARVFADIRASLKDDTSDQNLAKIYEICYGDYEGEEARRWSYSLEEKYMREKRLEYKCKPTSLRDKGGVEICITKAKVDMVSKVWGGNGTSLVLSLKGETRLPKKLIADKKKKKELVERKEAKASRRQKGEFYLKKKVRVGSIGNVVCGGIYVVLPSLVDTVLLQRAKEYGGCCTRELTGLF